MKIKLRQQTLLVTAPRAAVFARLATMTEATGQMDPETGEGARLVERVGNRSLIEFISRDGRKLYRTLEEVHLYADERVTFQHLEGPLHFSQEEFALIDSESGTSLTHQGEIECRMPGLPGLGWLVGRFYVRRRYQRLVWRHMNGLKALAEDEAGV